MCGIAGLLSSDQSLSAEDVVQSMISAIRYRGPDDAGVWSDKRAGSTLGHARLSILDLSPEGHQPMVSPSGRYVISYNGEVYNFAEIRHELEPSGMQFRGHSDTEVMLAAFDQWGIEASVQRFVGMFAFAVWDRQDRVLTLVRDRIGIKPLYYGWIGSTFAFGSELKALRSVPGFCASLDRNAIAAFFRFCYIPAPFSVYQGIYKLLPGTMLTVKPDYIARRGRFSPDPDSSTANWKPTRFWSAKHVAEQGCAESFEGTDTEAEEELDRLLRESVKLRMVSDVPLGAFLSGGVDSSTVVALMQAQSMRPVKTFSIGFHEADYNEAPYAAAVARHLGTEHTELYVSSGDALAVIPRLPSLYDEPFADSSQIPTFLVSELARRHVTVSLSGDGGDELFGGYPRYFWGRRVWGPVSWMPSSLRVALGSGIITLSPRTWTRMFQPFHATIPIAMIGDKLHKLAEILKADTPDIFYLGLLSMWKEPTVLVPGSSEPVTDVTDRSRWPRLENFIQRMMALDLMTYLPDDILTKVDRASMAVSLEARVPLLDHRVVEFIWRLPLSMKIRRGRSKYLLRRVLNRYVPRHLIERPKMGFCVPMDSWLRGPLKDWAEGLLDERRLRDQGLLNPSPIREKWTEHLSGARNWPYHLWNVLMLQAWLREQK